MTSVQNCIPQPTSHSTTQLIPSLPASDSDSWLKNYFTFCTLDYFSSSKTWLHPWTLVWHCAFCHSQEILYNSANWYFRSLWPMFSPGQPTTRTTLRIQPSKGSPSSCSVKSWTRWERKIWGLLQLFWLREGRSSCLPVLLVGYLKPPTLGLEEKERVMNIFFFLISSPRPMTVVTPNKCPFLGVKHWLPLWQMALNWRKEFSTLL